MLPSKRLATRALFVRPCCVAIASLAIAVASLGAVAHPASAAPMSPGQKSNLQGSSGKPPSSQAEPGSGLSDQGILERIDRAAEDTLQRIERGLGKDSAAAIAAIRAVLKTRIQVPVPPSMPAECVSKDSQVSDPWIKKYVDEASQPEYGAMTRLLEIQRQAQLLGLGADTYFFEEQLLRRQRMKAEDLLKSYRGKSEKILPILAFANEVIRQTQLVGGPAIAEEQQLFASVGAFLDSAIDAIVRDLVDTHDYRKAETILRVSRWADLFTDKGLAAKAFEKLEAAMAFRLKATFAFTNTGAEGDVEEWQLQAEFPLKSQFDAKLRKQVIEGSGIGRYLKYVDRDPNPRVRATMRAPDFPVRARIEEFDPCFGLAVVGIDRFNADSEYYVSPVERGEGSDLPRAQWAWQILFGDRADKGFTWFNFAIDNLKLTAINKSVKQTVNLFDGSLTVELTHTPAKTR